MCLIVLAWQVHPRFPLVVAGNRDEFFRRPTAAAGFWKDAPDILAGKDLEGGGTWMGVTLSGRFAALTNFRDPEQMRADRPSRGKLVADFLSSNDSPSSYLTASRDFGKQCNGYNLLLGDRDSLWWASNVTDEQRKLEPGIYGLSNHLLNSSWPKVGAGRTALEKALSRLPDDQAFFDMLKDVSVHPDETLPETGVGLEWERVLSSAFIRAPAVEPVYGTRSSTLLCVREDGMTCFDEITWTTAASPAQIATRRRYNFMRR